MPKKKKQLSHLRGFRTLLIASRMITLSVWTCRKVQLSIRLLKRTSSQSFLASSIESLYLFAASQGAVSPWPLVWYTIICAARNLSIHTLRLWNNWLILPSKGQNRAHLKESWKLMIKRRSFLIFIMMKFFPFSCLMRLALQKSRNIILSKFCTVCLR